VHGRLLVQAAGFLMRADLLMAHGMSTCAAVERLPVLTPQLGMS
jgi:hypothetical protein